GWRSTETWRRPGHGPPSSSRWPPQCFGPPPVSAPSSGAFPLPRPVEGAETRSPPPHNRWISVGHQSATVGWTASGPRVVEPPTPSSEDLDRGQQADRQAHEQGGGRHASIQRLLRVEGDEVADHLIVRSTEQRRGDVGADGQDE